MKIAVIGGGAAGFFASLRDLPRQPGLHAGASGLVANGGVAADRVGDRESPA